MMKRLKSVSSVVVASFVGIAASQAAAAPVAIDGLDHYVCHKAKDGKAQPTPNAGKFPKEFNPQTAVIAVPMLDQFVAALPEITVTQLYDFAKYQGICTPSSKQVVDAAGAPLGGTYPIVDAALHLVDFQVKQSKKDASDLPNPAAAYAKVAKGTEFDVENQFFNEKVAIGGQKAALIRASKVNFGVTVKCSADTECAMNAPSTQCNPVTKTCLPPGLTAFDPPPANGPGTANYVCYQAKQLIKQPAISVLLGNQFIDDLEPNGSEPLLFTVGKMTRLCLPADKANENPGAELSADHLACYKIKQATKYVDGSAFASSTVPENFVAGKAPKYKGGSAGVQTVNFGKRVLDFKGQSELCIPSYKSTKDTDDGVPACGDGKLYSTAGSRFEECDDGNNTSGDGCSATCVVEFCGDGTTQAGIGEQCDDGNNASGDGCSATCITEFCGDNVTNNNTEECDGTDDGACANACKNDCTCELTASTFLVTSDEPGQLSGLNPPSGACGSITPGPAPLMADPTNPILGAKGPRSTLTCGSLVFGGGTGALGATALANPGSESVAVGDSKTRYGLSGACYQNGLGSQPCTIIGVAGDDGNFINGSNTGTANTPPVSSPASNLCAINTLASPATGTLDTATGAISISTTTTSNLWIIAGGCPKCTSDGTPGGTLVVGANPGEWGVGTCSTGSVGAGVTPCRVKSSDPAQAGLSADCIPNTGAPLGTISIATTQSSAGDSAADAGGVFCAGQNAPTDFSGCFGAAAPACTGLSVTGQAAGQLSIGTPAHIRYGDVGCIPLPGGPIAPIVAGSVGLPGPLATNTTAFLELE